MTKTAFVFPGQGSQFVGMGKEVYEASPHAREVFEEVDESLKQNLTKIILNGDDQELKLTENTQPALMAVSIALLRSLEKEAGITVSETCQFVAGHSLGEYSALAAANSLSLSDTAKLLKIRGLAMQDAVPVGKGAMAALLGLNLDIVEKITKEASDQSYICVAANDNAPGQIVISGHSQAVEKAVEISKDYKCKKAVLLPVSAPFHCPLMEKAADKMEEALDNVNLRSPTVDLIANVTAEPVSKPDEIKKLLVKQVTGRVRWRETIHLMKELSIEKIVEIGAGKVLTGLNKRIDRDLNCLSIQTPDDIENYLKN